MKARLEFSKLANEDIDEIWLYIALDNVDAADRLMSEMETRFDLLARNPLLVTPRPELLDECANFRTIDTTSFIFRRLVALLSTAFCTAHEIRYRSLTNHLTN